MTELVNYPEVYDALSQLLTHPRSLSPHQQHFETQDQDQGAQEQQGEGEEGEGGKQSAREGREGRKASSSLDLSDDVLRYFQEERSRREEQELDERGRRVFGSR